MDYWAIVDIYRGCRILFWALEAGLLQVLFKELVNHQRFGKLQNGMIIVNRRQGISVTEKFGFALTAMACPGNVFRTFEDSSESGREKL
jgi:hypothetical protein